MSDDLQIIPGIGPSMAQDLRDLGVFKVSDLVGQDAEAMYKRLCLIHGMKVDRCVLYVFRCAIYFATEDVHDPELLKWWNWKEISLDDTLANVSPMKDLMPGESYTS